VLSAWLAVFGVMQIALAFRIRSFGQRPNDRVIHAT
jgi:hypothetical protein